jgi:hypothetical protein
LHHVLTNRQIGEVIIAHYLEAGVMAFELSSTRGRFLKAKPTGLLDYSPGLDEQSKFRIDSTVEGNVIYLAAKRYDYELNRHDSLGWFLSLSHVGELYANGCRDTLAQWTLVTAGSVQRITPNTVTGLSYTNASNLDAGLIRTGIVEPAADNPILKPNEGTVALPPPPPLGVVRASSTPLVAPALDTSSNQSTRRVVLDWESSFPGVAAGREDLMKYFSTPLGKAFLSQPAYQAAKALYERNGALAKLLHRPDWPALAATYVDYSQPAAILDDGLVDRYVSAERFKHFFEVGYVSLPALANDAFKLQRVRKVAQHWLYTYSPGNKLGCNALLKGPGQRVELVGDITQDPDLLALFHASCLPHLLQRLLGKGEVAPVTHGQIIATYPCLDVSMTCPALLGDQWRVEGFTETSHSPYSLLVGIALTDLSTDHTGNFCLHPGSHMVLLEQYRQQAKQHGCILSRSPQESKKADLGEPVQLLMQAGDVFLCTQRMAYLHALNYSSEVTMIAYYRISHVDHAVLKEPALQSMWLEYPQASRYLEAAPKPSEDRETI